MQDGTHVGLPAEISKELARVITTNDARDVGANVTVNVVVEAKMAGSKLPFKLLIIEATVLFTVNKEFVEYPKSVEVRVDIVNLSVYLKDGGFLTLETITPKGALDWIIDGYVITKFCPWRLNTKVAEFKSVQEREACGDTVLGKTIDILELAAKGGGWFNLNL